MLAGDVGEARSEPWTNRTRVVPICTYSGRIKYKRKKHLWTVKDAERIMAGLGTPAIDSGEDWANSIIRALRAMTIAMLERLLWFLDESIVEDFYQWCIDLLDRLFRIDMDADRRRSLAWRLIALVASNAGLKVTITR